MINKLIDKIFQSEQQTNIKFNKLIMHTSICPAHPNTSNSIPSLFINLY